MSRKNKQYMASLLLLAVVATSNMALADNGLETPVIEKAPSASLMFIASSGQNSTPAVQEEASPIVQDAFMASITSPDRKAVTSVISVLVGRVMTVDVTGYSSTVDQTDDSPFIAADGTHVYDGMIAANFLPFGTKVKIDGFGEKVFVVHDRMNKRYDKRVDIWFADRATALKFGKRVLTIRILES